MSEESAVPTPGEEPRCCPECGTRVAQRATSCLMCGASLVEAPEETAPVIERPARQPSRWLFWVAAVLVTLLVLALGRALLQPLLFPAFSSPTATPSPSPTPTHTLTPTPEFSPTPTATPTPLPPRAHQVQTNETLSEIALRFGTTVEEIMLLNPGITPELLQVGYVLLIPPAEPEPEPTEEPELAGPTPTPGDFILHVVGAGETLSTIAEEYGVTVALIRAANPEIPADSVIRVNQTLVIPLGTPAPTPTPTADPDATPTPIPLYPAPRLLSPREGAVFIGPDASIVLQWSSVGILQPDERYELAIGRPRGEPIIVRTLSTVYRVPPELYPQPGSLVREIRWQVRVVRHASGTIDEYVRASEQGPVRVLVWLEPTPSPSPTP